MTVVQEIRRTVLEFDTERPSTPDGNAVRTARPDMDNSLETQDVVEPTEEKDHPHLIVGLEIESTSLIHCLFPPELQGSRHESGQSAIRSKRAVISFVTPSRRISYHMLV